MKDPTLIVVLAFVLILWLITIGFSQTLVATPAPKITVDIKTVTDVPITVTGGTGNPRDHVGLYAVGSTAQLDWAYLNDCHTRLCRPIKGLTAGTVKFAGLKPGVKYEAKFFSLLDPASAVPVLKTTIPIVVALTPIDLTGPTVTVIRGATNDPDHDTIVIDGKTATLAVPKDALITSDGKPLVAPVGP
jgi:hypothetical protein